jgi:predicted dehydrogenase
MSFAYTFGKNLDDYAYGIMEVSDGYVLVGEALLGGGGKRNGVALKIGTNGSFVWYKTYGKNNNDALRFPFIAHDGNYIHFGYTQPHIR